MPYRSIDELPPQVKEKLSVHGQEIFLAAFNDAYKRSGGDEAYAFAVAWAAVGENYDRQADGTLKAITRKAFMAKGERIHNAKHATILQTLDRKIGDTVFRQEDFEATLDAWENAPIIFVPKGQGHPDLDAFREDPEKALNEVQGRIVDGGFKDLSIAVAGHPRLIGTADIRDKEIDSLIKSGKLSLSTAFYAPIKDGATAGPIEPQHVLIFEEDEKNMPKDEGSGFLNKEEDMADEGKDRLKEGLSLLDKARALFGNAQGPEKQENADMAEKELEAKLVLANKEIEDLKTASGSKDARIVELEKINEANKAELDKARTELAAHVQKQKDHDWEAIKNQLPPGMVHKDKEAEVRKMFEENPRALMEKILQSRKTQDIRADGAEAAGEKAVPRVGHRNAETGNWEG